MDSYRKVSWNALKFSLSGVSPNDEVELRISFDLKTRIANVRFWCRRRLVGEHPVKSEDIQKVFFKISANIFIKSPVFILEA
jgi:hypothetical protein